MTAHPNPVELLPERFAYIRDLVEKYALPLGGANETAFVDGLGPAQIQEIAKIYTRILHDGDAPDVALWIDAIEADYDRRMTRWLKLKDEAKLLGTLDSLGPSPRQPRALGVLPLLQELADRRIKPFTSGAENFALPPVALDWRKLPPHLKYLEKPAEKWGQYQFEEDRRTLDRRITKKERTELADVGWLIRRPEDARLLDKWMNEQLDLDKHPERDLIYWLLVVIEEFAPKIERAGLAEFLHPGPQSLDWTKLPKNLRYLASPAERFGRYRSPEQRTQLMLDMVEEQGTGGDVSARTEELFDLAERISKNNERQAIEAWLKNFPVGQYPEAALIHYLLAMLDDYFPAT